MTDVDEIKDPGAFAAELKAIAETVVKTKPLTKAQLIASDEVWEAVMEMKTSRGMTNADIAEVFKAKGWSEANADNMGYLIREAAKLRGEEPDGKKGRKPKTASKRSSTASSETSPKTSSNTSRTRGDERGTTASPVGGETEGRTGDSGAVAAGGKNKPEASNDAQANRTIGSASPRNTAATRKSSFAANVPDDEI
ncbi:hypothetical protein G6L68_25370 [Agrobacterium fabrum]|uniref:hypothetical protein n=1 Tax=Agrobacterium fabrum TaxID=1176649 RepID=UPI000EF621AB|nr:hypothetical protein [Agrobacterium fabrum]AYM66220.1 hypothetical protein At12D13_50680 [Agrobacterium fabrum]NTE63965.1 hypothetical protein [Agrobacterium fabrum]